MLDEAAGVGRLKRSRTQPHLELRERANDPEPCLGDDDGDRGKVAPTEPERARDSPAAQAADHDDEQPSNHEQHDGEVQRQHQVR